MGRIGALKIASHAVGCWGDAAFDGIPKAVFATVAWHLANARSGHPDAPGAAVDAFLVELDALAATGIIPTEQWKRARAAIAKATA